MPERDTGRSQPVYSAKAARQGEIVLNTSLRRVVFFTGLAAFVVIAIAVSFIHA